MPDQNNPTLDPTNQTPPGQSPYGPVADPAQVTPPVVSMTDDLPPIPSDLSAVAPAEAGSAAPSNLPPITPPMKKFGTGKIIATILGLLLLVGGIAGGVLLTQQNQNISEKAIGGYREEKKCTQPDGSFKWCLVRTVDCTNDSGGPISCGQATWNKENCENVTEPCSGGEESSCPGECKRDDPPAGCGAGYSGASGCGNCGNDQYGNPKICCKANRCGGGGGGGGGGGRLS